MRQLFATKNQVEEIIVNTRLDCDFGWVIVLLDDCVSLGCPRDRKRGAKRPQGVQDGYTRAGRRRVMQCFSAQALRSRETDGGSTLSSGVKTTDKRVNLSGSTR